MPNNKITYKDSGVDIEAGDEMLQSIKEIVQQTHGNEVLQNIGGFGGFFQPDLSAYKAPVLVSSVDGVGTKLIAAFKTQRYNTVGQDLVNHCVNDIAVCGADPLFFMDYFSTGSLDKKVGADIVKGFATACRQNGVALIGGETAEMPDIYKKGEFDLAGTIVGVADRDNIIDGSKIEPGDILLGFKSSGLHTNGYSLARKALFSEYEIDDYVDELGKTLGEEMLEIHRSYLAEIRALRDEKGVHGFAHITGGGIEGNTTRILPEGLTLQIDWDAWEYPPVFQLIQKIGNVPDEDMQRTFNLGTGLVAVINKGSVSSLTEKMAKKGEEVYTIGSVAG